MSTRCKLVWWAILFLILIGTALAIFAYVFYLRRTAFHGTKRTELTVTIPEGWTNAEIAAYLERESITAEKDFEKIAGPDATSTLVHQFSFLRERPAHTGLEGYLFPDTYRFYSSTSAEQVATKMLQNFDAKFSSELRAETIRQRRTLFEIITMASLIEKETAADNDRELVSGILWKRLDLGMPLQVDATLVFLTGKKTTKVSRSETSIDSLYNTYKYNGLPKGPIANPGLSAIHAALYAKKSPYLYYLSAPDGRIIYSRTLDEHNRAKQKYLR